MHLELSELLHALNPILRGWAGYFRYAAAKRTFAYLGYYTWWRVDALASQEAPAADLEAAQTTLLRQGRASRNGITLYNPATMRVERYRYRGQQISTPWNEATVDPTGARYRRTRHDDQLFLDTLQQALA